MPWRMPLLVNGLTPAPLPGVRRRDRDDERIAANFAARIDEPPDDRG
jgi:hypothetical protein